MSGIRKQAHPERVAPSATGTSFGSWSFATRPAWRAEDEIRAPATLVEATFHATADAGSIPAVSIFPLARWRGPFARHSVLRPTYSAVRAARVAYPPTARTEPRGGAGLRACGLRRKLLQDV